MTKPRRIKLLTKYLRTMKKIIFIILATFPIFHSAKAQNGLEIVNGYLKFSSIAFYEEYAENLNLQDAINDLAFESYNLTTLNEDSNFVEEDSLYPEFLLRTLNTDRILGIGNFLIKFDLLNHKAWVISANSPNAYNELVMDNADVIGMMVFDDEVENGIEILQKLENNEITPQNYQEFLDRGEDNDGFRKCKGAKRQKDATFQYWDSHPSSDCGALLEFCYKGEDKLVYQKVIFYFSIEAKRKSQKECCWDSRWYHFPKKHYCDLKIDGYIKYRKRCDSEVILTANGDTNHGHFIGWRPYSNSRSLSHYSCNVTFYARHTPTPTGPVAPYVSSILYHIESGY